MQLLVWMPVKGHSMSQSLPGIDWLTYCSLDTKKKKGSNLRSFMVIEFIDSSNYSTLFALRWLMGLDVPAKPCPGSCRLPCRNGVKVLVPFPRDMSTSWTGNPSVLDGQNNWLQKLKIFYRVGQNKGKTRLRTDMLSAHMSFQEDCSLFAFCPPIFHTCVMINSNKYPLRC